ncbi:hypothetical protein, partial [Streptomyces sodiiphilus]|uniref:hypothetical protein n=1 Tax=Streptomyces sodiiphilus TaxID=226217 RepID=UPI0031D0C55F
HHTTIPTYPFNRQDLVAPAARESSGRARPPHHDGPASTGNGQAAGHPLFDSHYVQPGEGR